MAGPIRIAILANGSQARREINSTADTASSKFGAMAGKVGKAAGLGLAVAGVAVVKFGSDSVKAASDAQQSLGATETVFGKFADKVVKDSNRAANQFGLSANQYRENANLIGALLKNQGVAQDKLGGKTKALIGNAADLAATYGGTTKDAVEALGSAFKGEFDPLEKYGISLKASTVNAEANALAQQKTGKSLDDLSVAQQTAFKQQATSALIAKQSADAQGAFARESDTLAHKQQVLAAKFEDVKVKVGNVLLPIMTKFMGFLIDKGIPAAEKAAAKFREWQPTIEKIAKVVGQVIAVLATFVAKVLRVVIPVLIDVIGVVVKVVAGIIDFGKKVAAAAESAVEFATKVKNKIEDAVGFVRSIPDRIKNAIGDLGTLLLNAGKDVVQGLIDGIRDKIGEVKSTLGKVTDLIPDWKGPRARDKRLLTPAGRAIIGGLVAGLSDTRQVRSTLGSLTNLIEGTTFGTPRLSARAAFADAVASALVEGRQVVELHLSADDLDALSRGRRYQADLDLAARQGIRSLA